MLRSVLFGTALALCALTSVGTTALAREHALWHVHAAASMDPARSAPVRLAFYVPQDPASLASLRQRAGDLDYVALHWSAMRRDGSVEVKANPDVITLVRSLGAKPLLCVTGGTSAADNAHAFLASPEARSLTVENLASAAADYDGIAIDFEGLYPEDRANLTQFMAQLAARLRPAGKLVVMALSAKTSDTLTGWAGAMDYAGLAPNADLFVLMAYGHRTSQSTVPGSTAPMPWVEASLTFALSQIPAEKLLLGVGAYGYDWDTTSGPPARALRYPDAAAIAGQQGVPIQQDLTQQSARFSYSKDGHTHEVWLEDASSVEAKYALVGRRGLAGVALWRLGQEDPQVWPALNRKAATATAASPWYFAEGSTAPPFDTWILVMNPNPTPAHVTFTMMLEAGANRTFVRDVPPTSRYSLHANQLLPAASFSTKVEADVPVIVERSMYFEGKGGQSTTGVTSPSRTWYMAEGDTRAGFDTWLLLMNPGDVPAQATVTFARDDGKLLSRPFLLAPRSRFSLFVNQLMPDVRLSMRIEADQPVIAERSIWAPHPDSNGEGS